MAKLKIKLTKSTIGKLLTKKKLEALGLTKIRTSSC